MGTEMSIVPILMREVNQVVQAATGKRLGTIQLGMIAVAIKDAYVAAGPDDRVLVKIRNVADSVDVTIFTIIGGK